MEILQLMDERWFRKIRVRTEEEFVYFALIMGRPGRHADDCNTSIHQHSFLIVELDACYMHVTAMAVWSDVYFCRPGACNHFACLKI